MPGSNTTVVEREARMREVSRLYLRGVSQHDICTRLGTSHSIVLKDLRALRARWAKETTLDTDQSKLEQLARIDTLEQTYWDAWERSLTPRDQTTQEREESPLQPNLPPSLRTQKTRLRRTTSEGNPAFLEGIRWCIAERCRILGHYAPIKTAPTTPQGDQPYAGGFLDALREFGREADERRRDLLPAGTREPGILDGEVVRGGSLGPADHYPELGTGSPEDSGT